MLDFTWKYQRITDRNGNWLYVYACPITRIIEVSETLSYLSVIIKRVNLSIQALLDAEDQYKLGVKNLIIKVLTAHNLDYSILSPASLEELFVNPGYLYSLNGFDTKEQPREAPKNQDQQVTLFEFEAKMVTRLIDTKMARNLSQALAIANSMPHDKLRAYVNARITQLDPEFEKREREKQDALKMMDNFADEFKSGKFFNSQGSILASNLNGGLTL